MGSYQQVVRVENQDFLVDFYVDEESFVVITQIYVLSLGFTYKRLEDTLIYKNNSEKGLISLYKSVHSSILNNLGDDVSDSFITSDLSLDQKFELFNNFSYNEKEHLVCFKPIFSIGS